MSKINWSQLKKEFILGDYKSLREFADRNKLNYNGNFMKNTKGWATEKGAAERKKSCKTIEKTIEKVAELEANRNIRHLKVWDKILDRIESLAEKETITIVTKKGEAIEVDICCKELADLSVAMDKAQKGQRLAEGLDKDKGGNSEAIAKHNEKINQLADLLNNPVENRKVQDFEDE